MNKKRNGSIDFLKFLFSVLILLHHGKFFADSETPIFEGGSIGVEFFFLISGIWMANSVAKISDTEENLGKDTFQFMKRKICGMLPDVYIAWIIALLVSHIGKFSLGTIIKDMIDSVFELLLITMSGVKQYTANSLGWYISAMLLAMLILYPLLKKYKDTFFYILAPCIVIFIMGITYQEWNNLRGYTVWNGWIFKGLVRAIMEITLGCICYKIALGIRRVNYTKLAELIWTAAEWIGYGAIWGWSYGHAGSKMDWQLVLILAVSVTISFSRVSITDKFFSNYKIFNWLGEFSFSLYLGHGYWAHKMSILFPELTYYQRFPAYLLISILTGLCIMYSSKGLKKWWKKSGNKWKAYFITESGHKE